MNSIPIHSQLTNPDGSIVSITYEDSDSFDNLLSKNVTQAYGVCFVGHRLVIVYSTKSNHWGLVGGSIETGETYEECLKREIKEESNMKVNSFLPIGYQEIVMENKTIYQLRYICLVEPYGNFISDPDESVTEIKLIDPKDHKQYFDWGEIGDRIIQRALELKSHMESLGGKTSK